LRVEVILLVEPSFLVEPMCHPLPALIPPPEAAFPALMSLGEPRFEPHLGFLMSEDYYDA